MPVAYTPAARGTGKRFATSLWPGRRPVLTVADRIPATVLRRRLALPQGLCERHVVVARAHAMIR
jgi:hypothetical protein